MTKLMTREESQQQLEQLRMFHRYMKRVNVAVRGAMKNCVLREQRIAYVMAELHGTNTPRYIVECLFNTDDEDEKPGYSSDDLRESRDRIRRYEKLLES